MLCWYIFITLSCVSSVGVQWGLNECLTTSNGKRKKEKKSQHKESWTALPLSPSSTKMTSFRCWQVRQGFYGEGSERLWSFRTIFRSMWEEAVVNMVGLTEADWMVSHLASLYLIKICIHPSSIYMILIQHIHTEIEIHTLWSTLRLTLSELQWYPFIICTRGLLLALAVLSTASL